MNVPDDKRREAIAFAKTLVRDLHTPEIPPHERLWQIARQLNVSCIEAGATRSQGFVKQLPDGSYGVYYSGQHPIVRRRYTVAHELSHLVLEKFVPHMKPENTVARGAMRNSDIERTVDRIAAELLIPEHLFVDALRKLCISRSNKSVGRFSKQSVLDSLRRLFGVSESAIVFRLTEVPQIVSMILRVMMEDAPQHLKRQKYIVRSSEHVETRLIKPTPEIIGTIDFRSISSRKTMALFVEISTLFGDRSLECDAWIRKLPFRENSYHEAWIVGWTWNRPELPDWDDSIRL